MRIEPLEHELADPGALELTDEPSCEAGIALPTVAQPSDPELVPAGISKGACQCRPGRRASPQPLPRALAQRREPRRSGRRARARRAAARADRRQREDRARAGLVAESRDEASRHADAPQVLEIAATRRKP